MLSGGGVFDHLDYSFSVGHEDGKDLEANGPGGGSPELRKRFRILSEFLNGLPLVEMRPDFEGVRHAGGVVVHALSSSTGEYAMYLDGNGPTTVVLSLAGGKFERWWTDVRTGAVVERKTFEQKSGPIELTTPTFRDAIALPIRRLGGSGK